MKKQKPPMPTFETRKQKDMGPNCTIEMTAIEKKRVFTAWRRFLTSDFAPEKFTKALYQHLSLHCSFIAHYNLQGFWNYYFHPRQMDEHTVRFIEQFDPEGTGQSAEYGYPFQVRSPMSHLEYYHDLNVAMVEEMGRHAERLRKVVTERRKAHARAVAESAQKEVDKLDGKPNLI
jgi:hypothetical protein